HLRSGDQAFADHLLARCLAGAADGFALLAGATLGRLLVEALLLHLAEDALALHLLFQDAEGLVDIVIAYQYLHWLWFPVRIVRISGSACRTNDCRMQGISCVSACRPIPATGRTP